MIVKSKHVRASRVSPGKASSALKSHLKYIQYRERDQERESKADRYLFGKDRDVVDRRDVHEHLMQERAGDIYYHRIILSPAHNEPVEDWCDWTRALMQDLEQRQGKNLDWYGVVHHNTDDPHIHVVLRGTGTKRTTGQEEQVELTPEDFRTMRQSGREHSGYEFYRQIQETLRAMDERDTVTAEAPLSERQQAIVGERDR